VRKADYQALAAAKRSGHLATIQFQLDLPPELNDIELTERWGCLVLAFEVHMHAKHHESFHTSSWTCRLS
jgi:hypothetical protein